MTEGPWYCTCQRAGPLIKERRAIRPRPVHTNSREDWWDKNEIIRSSRLAVCRSQTDRLELRLILFGFEGARYTLTYDSVHLPRAFREAMATKRASMTRARRFNEGQPSNWITCVEGLHGDYRYHIRMVLQHSDPPPAVVRHLWWAGGVDDEPVLTPTGGYHRLAEYLTKERAGGIIIPIERRPWNRSRSLPQQLPLSERWRDESGVIDIPDDVLWARQDEWSDPFGAYAYASYIQSSSSFNLSCVPAYAPARDQS